MLSTFFIERPIFANVIAIVTMLVGIVALQVLPVEQYPEITPPTVQVAAVLCHSLHRSEQCCAFNALQMQMAQLLH